MSEITPAPSIPVMDSSVIPERRDIPQAEVRARMQAEFAELAGTHGSQWDALWREGFVPWDRRRPNPALADALAERTDLLGTATAAPVSTGEDGAQGDQGPASRPTTREASRRRRRALVPGCGRGYDVYLLAARGWDAVGLEISAEAVRGAEALRDAVEAGRLEGYEALPDDEAGRGTARFVRGDFFEDGWLRELGLPAEGPFDVIYDYTFLCALPPRLRPHWAAQQARLLSAMGRLLCLEFPLGKEPSTGGPPFGVQENLYGALLRDPGQEIAYDERGYVKHVAADVHPPGPRALARVGRWQPARTHEVGRGQDMLSVWRHAGPVQGDGV